jgi:membrane-associated phospholipid phosphatase
MLKTISSWDLKISLWIQTLNNKPLKYILNYITWIGYPPQGFIFGLFLFLVEKRISFYFGIISLLAFVYLIKGLTHRPRPAEHHNLKVIHRMKSGSFPSSHTALYTYIFGHLLQLNLLNHNSYLISLILILIIILVGPSRIYRGEHWASDTIFGYILGLIWLFLILLSPS